jgi:hypothetical protein
VCACVCAPMLCLSLRGPIQPHTELPYDTVMVLQWCYHGVTVVLRTRAL